MTSIISKIVAVLKPNFNRNVSKGDYAKVNSYSLATGLFSGYDFERDTECEKYSGFGLDSKSFYFNTQSKDKTTEANDESKAKQENKPIDVEEISERHFQIFFKGLLSEAINSLAATKKEENYFQRRPSLSSISGFPISTRINMQLYKVKSAVPSDNEDKECYQQKIISNIIHKISNDECNQKIKEDLIIAIQQSQEYKSLYDFN